MRRRLRRGDDSDEETTQTRRRHSAFDIGQDSYFTFFTRKRDPFLHAWLRHETVVAHGLEANRKDRQGQTSAQAEHGMAQTTWISVTWPRVSDRLLAQASGPPAGFCWLA